MLINYMVNAFLRECNFSRHNFYFVGTMRNVSFQIIVRHKMHFPKIPVNKCMFRSAFFIKHSRLYVWYLTSITHQPKRIPSKSLQALKSISYEIGSLVRDDRSYDQHFLLMIDHQKKVPVKIWNSQDNLNDLYYIKVSLKWVQSTSVLALLLVLVPCPYN